MTQCASLSVYNEKYVEVARKYISMLETSSPSYFLMSSIASCASFMKQPQLFETYTQRLISFYRSTPLKKLRFAENDDWGKIVVCTDFASISGRELYDLLLSKYKIQCEAAGESFAIAMTSVSDTIDGFFRLSSALCEIDESLDFCKKPPVSKPVIPAKKMKACSAAPAKAINSGDAIGKISAEYVYAYPPGIPLIVPGEEISAEFLSSVSRLCEAGIDVVCASGDISKTISVVDIDI